MKQQIKSLGNSMVIIFSKEDAALWELHAGDEVEVKINKPIDWREMKRRV